MKSIGMINIVGLLVVVSSLALRLREWGMKAFADGQIDAMEARELADPIQAALNDSVILPPGQSIRVTIEIVGA